MKGKSIILLLVTLLILLVGAANAADTNTDGINTDISDSISTDAPVVNEVAVQEKQSVYIEDPNTVEKINKKQESDTNLIKTRNNLKKDTAVSSWETLESEINSATEDTTITLNKGTYTVTSRIDFNKPITITIDGNGSTIDGSQTQVFYINRSSSVILKNITIKNAESNGEHGGAIDNNGNLTIINSTLKNNTATGENGYGGAIYNNGTLTITDSNFKENTATGQGEYGSGIGGAIYNNGSTLNITQSNLTQNTATGQGEYGSGIGGAIYNIGRLNIIQSNLTQNTATGQKDGEGGAIYNFGSTLKINNTNLTQNKATGQTNGYGGAIYNSWGTLNINNTNLTQNNATGQGQNGNGYGGAIHNNDGTTTISNTLFYNNTPANFIIKQDNHIELTTDDNYISVENFTIIVDDTVKGTGIGTDDFNNFIVPMGDNIKLIFNGSNNINNTYILRSNTRTVSDYPSLIAAIEKTNDNYNKFIINLQPGGDYNATDNILYDSFTTDITINGNGQILNGQNTYQFIQIAREHNLTLKNITITNYTAENGGAIYNNGTLSIINSTLTQNNATGQEYEGYGGAIYNNWGTLIITGSNLTHNKATREILNGYGGAIYNEGGTNTISNTLFYNNTPANFIINQDNHIELKTSDNYISVGTFTIIADEEIYNNTMGDLGDYTVCPDSLNVKLILNGTYTNTIDNVFILRQSKEVNITRYDELVNAIKDAQEEQYDKYIINLQPGNYNATQNINWENSATRKIIINGNGQTLNGQNTYQFITIAEEHDLTLENITITNYTSSNGGAIYNSGNLSIINSTLTQNNATGQGQYRDGYGGAIYNLGGTLSITDSNLTQNTATGQGYREGSGGAICNFVGTLNITNSNLNYNSATGQTNRCGGAIYNLVGTLNITNSNLNYNSATGQTNGCGGAIYNDWGTLNITGSNLTQNKVTGQTGSGGSIYNEGGTNTISNTLFYNNTPANFIINQDNHIELKTSDNYISVGTFTIIADEEIYNNTMGDLGDYTVCPDSLNVKLILNGTYTNTIDNVFILRQSKEVNITRYDELVNAIKDAQEEQYDKYIINLQPGNYNATQNINWENSATRKIIINGNGQTLDGLNTYQFIKIAQEHNLTLKNITITNYTSSNGGAIYNAGTLTINNSHLTQNTATGQNASGGAIENWGTLTINNSNLNNNTVIGQESGYGGAIYNAGTVTMNNSHLSHNIITGQYGRGGAIENWGNFTISNSNLTHNIITGQEYGRGGAIGNEPRGKLNITNSNLTNNIITGQNERGSAIYNYHAVVTVYNNTFTNNLAKSTTGKAIIYKGENTDIHDNINADSSKYSSTIYTNNSGYVYPVSITFNTFDDKPRNTSIIISTNNTTIPTVTDMITITLELKDDFNLPVTGENITITINQNTTNITTDPNGIASVEYQVMSNETVINATYPGKDEDYNATNTQLTLLAEKMETRLLVDDVSTAVGKAFNITGTLLDINDKPVVDALVNITINGTKTNATTNETGQFNTTMTLHQMGEYQVNITFYENNGYKESNNNTALITASKIDTQLTLNVSNTTTVNNTMITITVNLTDNTGEPLDNQIVNITIEEETFTTTTTNGIAIKEYTVNKVGTQTITASYEGNNMYNANSTTTTINVYKIDTKLTLNVSNNTPVNNTQINITAILTDTAGNKLANQNITVTVAGKTFNIKTNSNGIATQTYTPTTLGKQTITATYNGTSQYINSTATTNITVKKINTKIDLQVSNSTPINNTPITITATLTDTDNKAIANQNITLNVTGKTFNIKTNNKGIATQTYTPTTPGKQIITATYNGDSQYINSTTTTNITVKKINTKIDLQVSNSTPINNTPITITATLTDTDNKAIANQNITLNVTGKTFNIKTNNKGIATQTYTPTTPGKQIITATYNGDSQYINSTATTNITVKKINTKIDLQVSNSTPINGTAITITATLTDTTGNKLANQNITLNVVGKTFNLKTNSKGIATQSYMPTTPGNQTITATYSGDSQYIKTTATTSITVKKINTKLTVKVSNSTPINSTSIIITTTLTDTDNKAFVNQNITLTVTGKTFNVKTNSSGVATQNYTLTELGKQIITATYPGDSQHNNCTATTNITVKKINTKIDLKVSNTTPINNTPINITVTLTDADNNKLANQQVTLNINKKTVTAKTNTNGQITQTYTPTQVEIQNITATYTGDSRYNNSTATINITVKNKINTQTITSPVTGVIGEKLSIKATVTDINNNKVNEGNLIFKLNGVTIKDNGKLTGSSNPLKVKVVNGLATVVIIPDLDMRNANKLTAHYIGTSNYNASASGIAKIQISQRNASIIVSSNVKTIKQGQVLTITAKVYDTTNGKQSTHLTVYNDQFVYFKVNGITLKDSKGNMLKVKVVNGMATINYTIPLGLSCVTDGKSMTPKNHTILAGFYNKNYQENIRNTSYFQVERSNITITISNATINTKTYKLSLTATIRDYLGNIVKGPNKCVIKVNGISLKNGTEAMYYYSTDGILNIRNIDIASYSNYKTIEIVTQDRLAYKSQRKTTSTIKVVNK